MLNRYVLYATKPTKGKIPIRIDFLGQTGRSLADTKEMLKSPTDGDGRKWGILRLPDDKFERDAIAQMASLNHRMPVQPSLSTNKAYLALAPSEDGAMYIAGCLMTLLELSQLQIDDKLGVLLLYRGTRLSLSGVKPKPIVDDIWGIYDE